MKEFIEKLIARLKAGVDKECVSLVPKIRLCDAIQIVNQLAEEYKDKYVSKAVLEQVMWERDIAIEQLKELGYGFGEKVGWIPVSERLPNNGQSIIAKYVDGKIWQENFSLYLYENPRTYQMVAWFPMPPEPYKEGE